MHMKLVVEFSYVVLFAVCAVRLVCKAWAWALKDTSEPAAEPFRQCNHVHVFKGQCVLAFGHDGDHEWTNPDATGPKYLLRKPAGAE